MLKKQIASLKSKINSLPQGDFFCSRNGKYYKWYHTDGKHQTLIPKKNREYAEQLVQRKVLRLQLEELKREKSAIDMYIAQHNRIPKKSEELLQGSDEYRKLFAPAYSPQKEDLSEWMNAAYEKSTKYPEQLIYKTITGNYVRSKSETLIDMFLFTNRIPFRYECALQLDSITLYPDFTIRHPRTGETMYWEHFGLMDDPNYSKNALAKLQLYISNGIIPTKQLITTYETKDKPLDGELVAKMIKTYFME